MDDDISWWLALQRVPGLGPIACIALLNAFGHPRELFDNAGAIPPGGLNAAARAGLRTPDWQGVERDLAWLAGGDDRHAVTLGDVRYPPLLATIPDPPPVLFVVGRTDALRAPQIAIVGSRSPSAAGRDTAQAFARALGGDCGLVVTSGLALGIDAAAHRGALAAGAPTVAVAGTGPDRVYPACHRDLAGRIRADGALVSEFPPGQPPRPGCFPRRNRIISGLSAGTLVVEAALGSGSLITARAALEQGREVFAIPGSIHNPCARGCHALIRQGATLVEDIGDILPEIGVLAGPTAVRSPTGASSPGGEPADGTEGARILSLIDDAPTAIDTLVARSGLPAERLYHILLDLELKNHIHSAPGGTFMRRRPGK